MSGSRLPVAASTRFYRQHPLQLLLALLGISLGAAVIVAVALATRTAALSFDRSLEALAGPMTHELRARDGALQEDLYRRLRLSGNPPPALPMLEAQLRIGDRQLTLVGIDPLALPPGGPAPGAVSSELPRLLTEPGAVLVPETIAAETGLRPGRPARGTIRERGMALLPLALFPAGPGDWLGDALLADIATVQELAGREGELDRIQLRLAPGEAEVLRRALSPTVELRRHADRRDTFDAMTGAFRTNLTAMSLLAMLVGAFLVYNTMAFAVVQRRATFAVLRMVGTTPRQLFHRLLLEAAALGLVGGLLGIALGLVLGQGLLTLVARTVSDLYVAIEPTRPAIAPSQLLTALAVTLGAVLAATLMPAREAARTAPVALEKSSAAPGRRRLQAAAGLVLLAACPLLLAVSGSSLLAGFTALFLLITGYALLCPALLRGLLAGLLRVLPRRGGVGPALALRGVESALPRTAPALTALAVAVAATVGVAIMIDSFRGSVASWLERTLQGDLYVYLEGEGERLAPDWEARLAALPGVETVAAARQRTLRIDGEPLRVLVLGANAVASRSFAIVTGPATAAGDMLAAGDGILVSEPLARRRGLTVGSTIELATPAAPLTLSVRGVYRDYASSYGAAVLPRALYERHWPDRELSSIALTLAADADPQALRRQLLALGAARGLELNVNSNRAIRDHSLAIFDRTFVITEVLRALVIVVAFVGILSALMALFLERSREFAVLRATGMTPRQLLGLVLTQAGASGLLAGLLALPLGGLLSILLIDVINRRSFGWSLATRVDPAIVLHSLLLAVAAAALAALWPARRLAGSDLRDALYAP
ncbi:ABC transporter permease [Pseudohaliea sp.]|uniref:ABC transporter permease n=1 Tax=Pseudohaliea sp. TaxID=2740289 RepID=UPI0032EBE603